MMRSTSSESSSSHSVSSRSNASSSVVPGASRKCQSSRYLAALCTAIIGGVVSYGGYLYHNESLGGSSSSDVKIQTAFVSSAERVDTHEKSLSLEEQLTFFHSAKEEFEARMVETYGEQFYKIIFEGLMPREDQQAPQGGGRHTFTWSPVSQQRLVRRLIVKLLSAQQPQSASAAMTREFTWATGGHSAAAGHGNLFSQAYTAILQAAASPVFSSVGLNLQALNYAIGGQSSGPEVAMCLDALFGPNVDVLSWDYGMTDGRADWKILLWGNRAALHPNKPFLLFKVGKRDGWRREQGSKLADMGMGVSFMETTAVHDRLQEHLPDYANLIPQGNTTMDNPQQQQQQQQHTPQIKHALKYFVCKNGFENPDPCGDYKFDVAPCEKAKFRTSWHPGWKEHLLQGNLMAAFLVHSMDLALQELQRLRHGPAPSTTTTPLPLQNDTAKHPSHDDQHQDTTEPSPRSQTFIQLPSNLSYSSENIPAILQHLLQQDETDREQFLNSDVMPDLAAQFEPTTTTTTSTDWPHEEEEEDVENTSVPPQDTKKEGMQDQNDDNDFEDSSDIASSTPIWRLPSICRTALLPSHTRYSSMFQTPTTTTTTMTTTENATSGEEEHNHAHLDLGLYDSTLGYHTGTTMAALTQRDQDAADTDTDTTLPKATHDKPRPLTLVYDPTSRQACNTTLNIDYRDVMLAREVDGWSSMILPTKEEMRVYGHASRHYRYHSKEQQLQEKEEEQGGMIGICLKVCAWHKCPKDSVQMRELRPPLSLLQEQQAEEGRVGSRMLMEESEDEHNNNNAVKHQHTQDYDKESKEEIPLPEQGNLTITVNDEPVFGTQNFGDGGNGCYLLLGQHGALRWKGRNINMEEGDESMDQYEVKFLVTRQEGVLEISSMFVLS